MLKVGDGMYLKHHGVKGMQWGVRKDRNRNSGKKNVDPDRMTTKDLEKSVRRLELQKRRDNLSKKTLKDPNEELKKIVERLELEKKFKDLSKAETDKGSMMVKAMKEGLAQSVKVATAAGAMYVFKKLGEKIKKKYEQRNP